MARVREGQRSRPPALAIDTPTGYNAAMSADAASPPPALHLAIDGMHCGACVRRVRAALEKLPGVTVTEVAIGRAEVVPGAVAAAEVVAALARAGYPAREGA